MNATKLIPSEHVPTRQCVGCRAREPQRQLVRIAVMCGKLAVDPRRRLPGRGAYVHGRAACIDRALKRGGLFRSLRVPVRRECVTSLRTQLDAVLRGDERATLHQSLPKADNRHATGLTQPGTRLVVEASQSKDQG